jgi:hypothetical protein
MGPAMRTLRSELLWELDGRVLFGAAADQLQENSSPTGYGLQAAEDTAGILHGVAVDCDNHIARKDTGLEKRGVGLDIGNENPGPA